MKPHRRRVVRNLVIAVCAAAAGWGIALMVGLREPSFAASLATAYVGFALLASTLLVGPLNVLGGRPNPVSTHLRRDLGIWGGVVSLMHVAIGLRRHMGGRWWLYFTFPRRGGRLFGLRYDTFGLANWVGLTSALVICALIGISSDAALRRLGAVRWKWIQRGNYVLFLGVVLHGFEYVRLSHVHAVLRACIVAATALGVLTFQMLGMRRVRAASVPAARSEEG